MQFSKEKVLLKAENISLKYGENTILRDINLEIQNITRPDLKQGQVISLIGRSGIGKTQLFKILSGLNTPTSGQVRLGEDLHPVQAGEVGIIPQNYILFNHRTIFSNLKLGLDNCVKKHTEEEKKAVINDYAKLFDLEQHLNKYPQQLSGGQRQRVSIIQQVLTGNKFLLFDEPFSGLDALMIDKVTELLLKVSLLDEHNTLIIVSHDIESCLAISDTAWIIANEPGKQGATITEMIDLIHLGLAWRNDIRLDKQFIELVANMKYKL
jgi:ABC-type nitrate/sulfonate/bicarbonate transport system ATPase subunit